ncbi:MAG: hypothetical protein RLZZ606_877, partial [Actinomycetota bacterium]
MKEVPDLIQKVIGAINGTRNRKVV